MAHRVLLVQSDMKTAQPLARYFTQRDDEVWQAWELGQAWAFIDQVKPNLIFMDLHYASGEWIHFIRRVRQTYPAIKIVMTNKYPDLQREMLVREQNVQVFLRQPFSARWIEQALERVNDDTQPVNIRKSGARSGGQKKKKDVREPHVRPVRVPLLAKITLPYLLIGLVFAFAGMFLVGRVILEAVQNRVLTQLVEAGLQTTDRVVIQALRVSTSQTTILLAVVVLILGIVLVGLTGLYLSRRITRSLQNLTDASIKVAEGNWEIKVNAAGDDETAVLAQSFNYMVAGLQEGLIYRDLTGQAVTAEVREQLRQTFSSGNLRLEGQQSVATVLVSRIQGFTRATDKADAAAIFQWLNEYFAQVAPIISAHGGVINTFDGDHMMAFFGILPRLLSPKQSAAAATQAATEIVQAVDQFNAKRLRRGEPAFVTTIGLHTGLVSAGGLGTSDRLHYTVLGETVDLAYQVERLSSELKDCSGVLVSQATWSAMGGTANRYQMVPLDGAAARDQQKGAVQVYKLVPDGPPGR